MVTDLNKKTLEMPGYEKLTFDETQNMINNFDGKVYSIPYAGSVMPLINA